MKVFSFKNHCFKDIARLIFFIVITTPTIGHSLFAQNNPLKFERVGFDQGLSQTTVYSTFQDSRGFMWFGTRDGLHKYDGYRFTVYRNRPGDLHSVSNNTIRAIYEDVTQQGVLWITTYRWIGRSS